VMRNFSGKKVARTKFLNSLLYSPTPSVLLGHRRQQQQVYAAVCVPTTERTCATIINDRPSCGPRRAQRSVHGHMVQHRGPYVSILSVRVTAKADEAREGEARNRALPSHVSHLNLEGVPNSGGAC
jgi:hypothetical protein